MEQPTEESVRKQIAELRERRDASTDKTEREDLADVIQSIAMGWQFREAAAESAVGGSTS